MIAALALDNPRHNIKSKIDHFVALAPAVFVYNLNSPVLRALANMDVAELVQILGFEDFASSDAMLESLLPRLCHKGGVQCDDGFGSIVGQSTHINVDREPVFMAHFPAGTSTKNMIHWVQHIRQQRFGMYDYGHRENLLRYGQQTPPEYDLQKFASSGIVISLFFGENDALSTTQDRQHLESLLADFLNDDFQISSIPGYSHVDFMWGRDTHQVFIPKLLKRLKDKRNNEESRSQYAFLREQMSSVQRRRLRI